MIRDALPTVVASGLAVLAAWLTSRASSRAQAAVAETTSRGDLEREAFERAKEFYTDTIDRQAKRITELEDRVAGLEREIHERES